MILYAVISHTRALIGIPVTMPSQLGPHRVGLGWLRRGSFRLAFIIMPAAIEW